MSAEVPLCIDCAHYSQTSLPDMPGKFCRCPRVCRVVSLVNGRPLAVYCRVARGNGASCGVTGVYFEPSPRPRMALVDAPHRASWWRRFLEAIA